MHSCCSAICWQSPARFAKPWGASVRRRCLQEDWSSSASRRSRTRSSTASSASRVRSPCVARDCQALMHFCSTPSSQLRQMRSAKLCSAAGRWGWQRNSSASVNCTTDRKALSSIRSSFASQRTSQKFRSNANWYHFWKAAMSSQRACNRRSARDSNSVSGGGRLHSVGVARGTSAASVGTTTSCTGCGAPCARASATKPSVRESASFQWASCNR
mmetsp:Transcript_89553/g.252359  ORF Transcript_89553/g.252359 Transcript_89553/m.252359 type:complete len:215 (+) Transcript_89553:1226-1870(+)